jgi:hypothetical protein
MLGDEEDYKKRFEEVSKKLNDPKISKKVDDYLKKIALLVDCDVELNFNVLPFVDDYSQIQESGEFKIPEHPTMKLHQLVDHLTKEHDQSLDVYIDPIYLRSNVNEIVDVLITTIDQKIIIVPISNKKTVKL